MLNQFLRLSPKGYAMKKATIITFLMLSSLTVLANTGGTDRVTCTGNGVVRLVEGVVQDGILNSTVTLYWGNQTRQIPNVAYSHSADSIESYYLLENETSAKLKFEGLTLFLPQSLYISEKFNISNSWIPTLDEAGNKSPTLIAFKLVCEKK